MNIDFNIPSGAKVAVALSGGLDSLMAANELLKKGCKVFGLHARFFDTPDFEQRIKALELACEFIGIELYVEDLRTEFTAKVIEPFIAAYVAGFTPNPCVQCNPHLKFGLLLDAALKLGGDYIATGHYACKGKWKDASGREFDTIFPAKDKSKDQAYFLALVPGERLSKSIFPLFNKSKAELREEASLMGLPLPEPKESQEICFVPNDDYRSFLKASGVNLSGEGLICLSNGLKVGKHKGLWQYTEGQRRGLGIAWAEPLYVVAKNMDTNTLIVGHGNELKSNGCKAVNLNLFVPYELWPEQVLARVRYRQQATPAVVVLDQEYVDIRFLTPQVPPAKGQLATLYHPDGFILGGGLICQSYITI